VIHYPEDDGGPKPYVMWEMQSYEQVGSQEDEQAKITVTLTAATCSVSMSMPTGVDNFALLDAFQPTGYQGVQSYGGSGSGSMGGKAQHNIMKRNQN
jgi:hypothetical protein